jgi:hypothetical protein
MRTLAGLLNQKSLSIDAAKGTTEVWILQFAYHRSSNRRPYLNHRGMHELSEESPRIEQAPAGHRGLSELWKSARLLQQDSCPTSHCKSTIEH